MVEHAKINNIIILFISNFFLFTLSVFFYLFHFLDNQRVVAGLKGNGFESLLQSLEYDEEGWNDEKDADSAEEHTTNSTDTYRAATICTSTRCKHQRQHTDNHRQ